MIRIFKIMIRIPGILLFCLAMLSPGFADTGTSDKHLEVKAPFELGMEYLWPTNRDRRIQTTALNMLWRHGYYSDLLVSVYSGLTLTYAWGNSIQKDLDGRKTEYSNSAFGIGPQLHFRWAPVSLDNLTFSMDANGGFIFHNKEFPAGGDLYNFIWRIGPSIQFQLEKKEALIFGLRIMHVSNAQGRTRDNPAYNAAGVGLHVVRYF